jgi:hypothetical protein
MNIEQGFCVEVPIRAPRDAVWRALTDPSEIRRWFGWDYEGLVGEIDQIFGDDAKKLPPGRIEMGWEQTIELIADGSNTLLRIVKPGPLADASWDDAYDEMVRGWHGFFLQLRHYLERHPGEDRQTIFLDGTAEPAAVLATLDAEVPGTRWLDIRHQQVTAVEAFGGGLIAILAEQPLSSTTAGKVQVTITTHGMSAAQFADVQRTWAARWNTLTAATTAPPAS